MFRNYSFLFLNKSPFFRQHPPCAVVPLPPVFTGPPMCVACQWCHCDRCGDNLAMFGYRGSSSSTPGWLIVGIWLDRSSGALERSLQPRQLLSPSCSPARRCGCIVCMHMLYAHMEMLSRNTRCCLGAGVLNTHQEISEL